MQPDPRLRFDLTLLMVFVLVVGVSGFSPRSRVDWALENLLVLLLVGTLVAVFRDPEHHAVDILRVRTGGVDRRGLPGQ